MLILIRAPVAQRQALLAPDELAEGAEPGAVPDLLEGRLEDVAHVERETWIEAPPRAPGAWNSPPRWGSSCSADCTRRSEEVDPPGELRVASPPAVEVDELGSHGPAPSKTSRLSSHCLDFYESEGSSIYREGDGGTAAHTGPQRKGPEAWPPRKKVGAGERSPSAPRLGPSIVKERGGETPRDEPGEPRSPVPLPSGEGFTSCKDLFAPRSPLFAPHSPTFEPSEGEGERRELHLGRRDGEVVSRSLAFAPPDRPFAARSPERARLEEPRAPSGRGGTRRS
jgi:hypothetical protein